MALQHVNCGLTASFANGQNVEGSHFLERLLCMDSPIVIDAVADGGVGRSSIVTFIEKSVSDFLGSDDPYLQLERALVEKLDIFANWLSLQDENVFLECRLNGLCVNVFIEFWINQDQFDCCLPPVFLYQCGRLSLDIKMSSNE